MLKKLNVSFRTITIFMFIVMCLLFLSIYSSMALFTKTVEKKALANIVVADVTPSISSSDEAFVVTTDSNSGNIKVKTNIFFKKYIDY